MSEKPLYEASEWGSRYHMLKTDEALGAGSAGPGKSLVLLMDPVPRIRMEWQRCQLPEDHPHFIRWGMSKGKALHLRRTLPMLEETIDRSKTIYPLIDPAATFNQNAYLWTFSSGYKVKFWHCNELNDWMQYQSQQYDWIGFDELTQFDKEQYDQIKVRNRSGDPLLRSMCCVRSMSNPYAGREHMGSAKVRDVHWVRNYFVRPTYRAIDALRERGIEADLKHPPILKRKIVRKDGRVDYVTRVYLHATLYDNPDPAFVEDYERKLLDAPPHIRQAMLYGNWDITVGSHFAHIWDANIHTCRPFKIPSHWKLFRSLDWGFVNFGAIHWWALDDDDRLWCIKEYSFKEKHPEQVAAVMKVVEKDLGVWGKRGSLITGPADTQLWERRGENTKSKADEFYDHGVIWEPAQKGPGSRAEHARKVAKRLSGHQDRTRTPDLVIFQTCSRLIETLPALQTNPDNTEEPVDGGDDHWYDSCCYGVSYASNGRAGIPSLRKERDEWEDEPQRKKVDRGTLGYG